MDERARIEEKSRGIQEVITWRKFGSAEDIFRHEMHRHLEEEIKKREEKIKQYDLLPKTLLNKAMVRGLQERIMRSKEAQDKIAEKNFGKCQRCGKQIPDDLLLKMPWLSDCPDCRKAINQENKMSNPVNR
ncbi:MAG: TraR/DksA C4-type zinc finger protein [Patescibacteria group bacterium]